MAIQKVCKFSRLLVGIIDPVEEDVLERKTLAGLERSLKFLTCRQQLLDRPLLVNRHQLVAQVVSGRSERDGKMRPGLHGRQFPYPRNDARGGHGHATRDDM